MKIKKLSISNFRAIKNADIELDNQTVILGKNGSGKSSLLHAIDYFYDESKKGITIEDFHYKNAEEPIVIQICFYDLLEKEKERFGRYYHNSELVVQKEISYEDGKAIQKYYGFSSGIDELEKIKAISGATDKKNAYNEIISSYPGLQKATSGKAVDEAIDNYYSNNQDKLTLVKSQFQFYGDSKIGGGSLDNYTKFVFIPAVKEAADDYESNRGVLNGLIDILVKRKIQSRKDIIEFKAEMEKIIKSKFNPDELPELTTLEYRLTKTLRGFEPHADIKLKWLDPNPFEINLPGVSSSIVDDGFEGDIRHKGHGLQRSVIFTLLKEIATIGNELDETIIEQNSAVEKRATLSDLIICFEEPELYQHPLKCKYMSDVFNKLTDSVTQDGNTQIIFTTHSPYFVSLIKFNKIIKFLKKSEDGVSYFSTIRKNNSEDIRKKVAAIREKNLDSFSIDVIHRGIEGIMTSIVNEGYFADIVVLVEGISDATAIDEVAKRKNIVLSENGIALISVEGKESFDIPYAIFSGLGIQTYIIFDGDKPKDGSINKSHIKDNRKCFLLSGIIPIDDYPKQSITAKYACFENKLEGYLEQELGLVLFTEIKEAVLAQTNARELKNAYAMHLFIREVYNRGMSLPFLEDIIDAFRKLAHLKD